MKPRPDWQTCLERTHELPEQARCDVESAMRHVDPGFPRMMWRLACDVGLTLSERQLRCDALLFVFTSIQVADDLADGDCDYLVPSVRVGPGVHWLLQHLFYRRLLQSDVPPDDIERSAADLIAVGAAQQVEVRVEGWSSELSLEAARSLNGRQYAAYFRVLFAGTRFSGVAAGLGRDFGLALHLVTDRMSRDRRWSTLTSDEQSVLTALGREAVARATKVDLPSLREPLRWFDSVLEPSHREVG